MQQFQFFSKDIKEVSTSFCALTEEEVETLYQEVLPMSTPFKVRVAQLLALRGDASRILALHELGEPELTKVCSRYLKTNNIRKALFASFTDEETFIDLFNGLSETAKELLLECLVWNKKRDAGCLADRLLDHPKLSLTITQHQLLVSACSVQKYISYGHFNHKVDRNAFFKRQKKSLAECAVREMYYRFHRGEKDLDKYVCFLPSVWKSVQIDGNSVRICDLILDIWKSFCINPYKCLSEWIQNCGVYKPGYYSNHHVNLMETHKSVENYARYIVACAPLYAIHKFSVHNIEYTHSPHYEKILHRARLLGDEEVFNHVIDLIRKASSPIGSWVEHLDSYLSEEDVKRVIDAVVTNTIEEIASWNVITGVKDCSYLDLVEKFLPVMKDEHSLRVLDILSIFESKFSERGYIPDRYFGLFQKEVPRDFLYHKVSEEVLEHYPTVRQFERTLCVKGNTHLCKSAASDRIDALNTLLGIACRSMDVRAIHRVVELLVGMVMPDPELHLDSKKLSKVFSPDCLGLSEKSLQRSGSAEAAAFARKGIMELLEKSIPSEENEINILFNLVLTLYTYASVYVEYEEVYCEMMKPLIRLLVNDKVSWTEDELSINSCVSLRSQLLNEKLGNKGMNPKVIERMKPFCDLERYLRGELEYFHPRKAYYPSIDSCEELPRDQVPPLSRRGLEVIFSCLDSMEDVSVYHVKVLVCTLIQNTSFKNTRTIYKENEVGIEAETGRMVKSNHSLTIQSADVIMLRKLFTDKSLQWKGTQEGLSLMQTLFLTENTASMTSLVTLLTSPSPKWGTSISLKERDRGKRVKRSSASWKKKKQEKREKEQKEEEDENSNELFLSLSKNCKVRNAFAMRYGANMINFRMKSSLRVQLLTLPQKMIVTTLPMDQESLKKCVDVSKNCYLSRLILPDGQYSEIILANYIHLLTDENLLTLFSLGRSYLQVVVHSTIATIYIHKKESIVDTTLNKSLLMIPRVLFDLIRVMILINREITMRDLHPENCEIDLVSPVPFLTRFLQSVLSESKQTIREMKVESLEEEKEKEKEKNSSTKMEVEEVKEEEVVFEPIKFDISKNDFIGRLVELIFFSRDIHAFFEAKRSTPQKRRMRGRRSILIPVQTKVPKKFPSVVRIARMMSIPVMLAICRRLMITTTFIPYADALLHIVLKSTNKPTVVQSVVSLLRETHHCITVAFISLFVRIASMPAMGSCANQLKKLVHKILKYATENKFQSVSVYFSILRFVLASILRDEEEPEESFMKELITTLIAVDIESEAGDMVFKVIMTFYAKLNHTNTTVPGCSSTCTEYVNVLNTLYENAKEGRPAKVKALLNDVVMNFGLAPTNSNFTTYLLLLRQWHIVALPDSLINQCVEVIEQPWRYYKEARLYGAALSLLFTIDKVKAIESIKKGQQTIVVFNDMTKTVDERVKAAQIPKELEEVAQKAIRENVSIPQILSQISGTTFPLSINLAVWSELGSLGEDFLPLSLFAKGVLDAMKPCQKDIIESYKDCTLDVNALAERMETFAPWVTVSLMHMSSELQSFTTWMVTNICTNLQTTNQVCHATLLAIILNKNNRYDYQFVKVNETGVGIYQYLRRWILEHKVYKLYSFIQF